jgi:hypothetical protein
MQVEISTGPKVEIRVEIGGTHPHRGCAVFPPFSMVATLSRKKPKKLLTLPPSPGYISLCSRRGVKDDETDDETDGRTDEPERQHAHSKTDDENRRNEKTKPKTDNEKTDSEKTDG